MDSDEKKQFWNLINRFDEFADVLDEWNEVLGQMQAQIHQHETRLYNLEVMMLGIKGMIDTLAYNVHKKAPA